MILCWSYQYTESYPPAWRQRTGNKYIWCHWEVMPFCEIFPRALVQSWRQRNCTNRWCLTLSYRKVRKSPDVEEESDLFIWLYNVFYFIDSCHYVMSMIYNLVYVESKDLPTTGLTAESGQIKTGPSLTHHRAWNRIKSIDRSPPSQISIKTSSILFTCWILTILKIIGGFFLKVTL